jgi:hypothetical protein
MWCLSTAFTNRVCTGMTGPQSIAFDALATAP